MTKRYHPRDYTASGAVNMFPFGNEQDGTKFKCLEEKLQAHLSIDYREQLNEVASKFLMARATSKPPRLNESKAACKKIVKGLKPAIETLKILNEKRSKTKDRLCSISPRANLHISNVEVLIDGLTAIVQASDQLQQKDSSHIGRPLEHSPLWQLIADMAPIYKKVTGKRITASTGQHSPFVVFIIQCIELIFDLKEPLHENLNEYETPEIAYGYSAGIINNTTIEVIAILNLKGKQEGSFGNNIPLCETEKGMLNALQKQREENKQAQIDLIKNKRKR